MTLKVVNEIIDTMPVFVFFVQESDFSALLIAQVMGGFSPEQPGTFTCIEYIDIQFNRSSWWHSEAVGEYVHIRWRFRRQIAHRLSNSHNIESTPLTDHRDRECA